MILQQDASICEREIWEGCGESTAPHSATSGTNISFLENVFFCLIHHQVHGGKKKKNRKYLHLVFYYSCTHCYRQCLAFTFVIMLTMCYRLAVCDLGSMDLIVFLCRDYWLAREKLFNFLSKHMKCSSICSCVSDFGRTAFFDGCKDQRQEICYYPQSFQSLPLAHFIHSPSLYFSDTNCLKLFSFNQTK